MKIRIYKKFMGNVQFQKDLFAEMKSLTPMGSVMEADVPNLYSFLKENSLCVEDKTIYLHNPNYKLVGVVV